MTEQNSTERKGYLLLEDGTKFEGILFGAPPSVESYKMDLGYGEVVFNTSMTGYQEILTDPSYFGQIVCMTAAHIGNTGINLEDAESRKIWCSGFVVQSLSENPSNWRSSSNLIEALRNAGIPGLCEVDTRSLTQYIRRQGALRGLIVDPARAPSSISQDYLKNLPPFEGRDLIKTVTTPTQYRWQARRPNLSPVTPTPSATSASNGSSHPGPIRIAALDFGIKWNLLDSLAERGAEITVFPATATSSEILDSSPDGIFLSNGPGDPAAATYAAQTVRALIGRVPIFGVCMGHQVLALAMGARTYKLKFGHRGGNQPVKDLTTERVEISSHNHGYAVREEDLPSGIAITHRNLNDGTVEGLEVIGKQAFSVQYHPEACPGPHDSIALFDRFIDLIHSRR